MQEIKFRRLKFFGVVSVANNIESSRKTIASNIECSRKAMIRAHIQDYSHNFM